ncbi:MAG: putative DNA binding domain-containing protein [Clostridiales Family XIII bacterium]|jgi:ATP-dependent DNA helicase RecG|nr:putative DNA binding domain-containing protein [Clostridiales Family XIII bacterium]
MVQDFDVVFYEAMRGLELRKPKSWLKTVSAFANGIGGSIYVGVSDDGVAVGLDDIKLATDKISEQIKVRIFPPPEFTLTPYGVDGGNTILVLRVPQGETPPYYFVDRGQSIAFVRMGNQSCPASPQRLTELSMRGKNLTFDSLPTDYTKSDLTFAIFEAAYKKVARKALTLKEYVSFGLCRPDGTLTYAGLLFADDCPLLQARVFCTHWDGLNKGSLGDAIDSDEFEGDVISLLRNSHNFVRLNSRKPWRKMADHRVGKPDYADRAVFEILANALMHRDWSIVGSEIHVDMYDDRLDVYSPGGMASGKLIQSLDIDEVPSIRRNPILADVFHRLSFAERQGSGLRRIREETSRLHGYTEAFAPRFVSTSTDFHVVLVNMNRDLRGDLRGTTQVTTHDTMQDERIESLLEFCYMPRTRNEMQRHIRIANREHFRKNILKPLIESGQLAMTIPDKPQSRNQKYVSVIDADTQRV